MKFIVDSREQKPFVLSDSYQLKTLIVGDYTTEVLLGKFHIERKSLIDLYNTITKGHLRFKKEIIRAKHHNIKLVVMVEGTKSDFEAKKFWKGSERLTSGETLIKIVNSITLKHGVQFIWHRNRRACEKACYNLLFKMESEYKKKGRIN